MSTNVGQNQPNKLDDVELVRFGYTMLARSKEALSGKFDGYKAELAAMLPTGGYGPDLLAVIKAHQRHRGGTQDGVVSVARVTSWNQGRYDDKHQWIILTLNTFMHDFQYYPRIDLHPNSGFAVSKVVRDGMLGADA